MGVWDKLKGAASTAWNFYKGKKYRQNTLYDFSVLTKAKLRVYKYKPGGDENGNDAKYFTEIEDLPFQINPTSLNNKRSVGEDLEIPLSGHGFGFDDRSDNSLNLTAEFSIADEYMVRTHNAVLPIDFNMDEMTIIDRLYFYSSRDFRVLFMWGPFTYLATIAEVSCEYREFSPYGEPLRASVNLRLARHRPNTRSNVLTIGVDKLEKELSSKAFWSTEKISTVAQLSASTAASEALPSIIRAMR